MIEMTKRCIGDLGKVIGGATPSTKDPSFWDGDVPWITPKDLASYSSRYICGGNRSITVKGASSCSTTLLTKGSVLFSSRAPIGYIAIAGKDLCTNQGFKSIIPNEETDSLFLYYLLRSNKDYIASLGSGTTFKEISGRTFGNIQLDIPKKKSDQEAIAAILDSLDSKIELNSQINDYLLELLKASAKNLYADYERNEDCELPEGWRWVEIDEIAEMVCRGITPKYNPESDETVLGQTCVRNNLVLLENGRLHMPKKVTEKWLQKYDLLINSTGVGSLGRTAQVWFEPSKLVVDSHITIVRCENAKYALYLGFWAFEHEKYIESLHTGSTGQIELPRDHVKAIRFVLPSEEELEKFNAVAAPAVELIVANQQESKRLAELRDTLLPKLMSGEVDVSKVDLTQLNNHLAEHCF